MTPAALHGHLHWLQHPKHMVAFDMVAKTFKQMMPPPVTTKFFANLLAMDKFLMASEFMDLGMDLWVMEGYGAMDERWELQHRIVLPWQLSATHKRPLLVKGGDDSDVIMGTTYGLGVYNAKSKTFRVVITVKPPDALLLSRNMLRESLSARRNHVDDIGGDLVYEILIRLPAKPLLRSGAVCKAWRRITTDPAFLSDHSRRRPLEAVLYSSKINLDDPINGRRRRRKLGFHRHRPPLLPRRRYAYFDEEDEYCVPLASCDGLLLLRKNAGDYAVCNPATRRWAQLPPPTRAAARDVWCTRESVFYFHPPSGEYRLLCHCTGTRRSYPNTTASYYVLAAGGLRRRRLGVQATPINSPAVPRDMSCTKLMAPAALHGRLHWLLHPESGLAGDVVAFDTVAETFTRMAPPPVTRKASADLLATDGCLMASEFTASSSVDLWVLDGYHGGGGAMVDERWCWQLRHRVVMPWEATISVPRLVAGGDDGDVILAVDGGGLGVYNVRSETVVGVEGLPWFVHRESLG
uniref:F-box domain-containing protein n=1 Tax=Oryza meridionalis TaxID=40149 RepID=A0A0E0EFW1_9ORYZ